MKYIPALVLFFSSLVAFSQQAPAEKAFAPAAQAASVDDLNRLIEVMHIRRQMTEMQKTMLDQYRPMLEKIAGEQLRGMTPQQRQKFQDIMSDMMAETLKAYPPDEMIHDMFPIYQKYLDHSDVEALVSFYSSPAGAKFLDIQPKIVRDFMAVLMPKMQDRMQVALRKMQQRVRDLAVEENSQPPEQGAKPAPRK